MILSVPNKFTQQVNNIHCHYNFQFNSHTFAFHVIKKHEVLEAPVNYVASWESEYAMGWTI
jgi:hypothetical protein